MPLPDELRTYSPGLVTVIFGEVIMVGYADGSFMSFEMAEDAITEQVGEDGSVVLNQSLNEVGEVTVRLWHQSPTNDLLQSIHNNNRLAFGSGVRPLRVVDGNGNTTIDAPQAWISRIPNVELADQASPREWKLRGSPMRVTGGGNGP